MIISILGTGAMGTAMGEAILKNDVDLYVYNRTKSKTKTLVHAGAVAVDTIEKAINKSDICIFVFTHASTVLNLLSKNSIKKKLRGKIVINASTSDAKIDLELEKLVEKNEGKFAAVAMQSIPTILKKGKATFLVGCKDENWKLYESILSQFSQKLVYAGEVKDLFGIDLASRIGFTLSLVKVAYMVASAQKYNIEREIYNPIISDSDPYAKYFLANMNSHKYPLVSGSIEENKTLLIKDIEALKEKNISVSLLENVLELFEISKSIELSESDASSILEILENNIDFKKK